jgi:hypothetical protein
VQNTTRSKSKSLQTKPKPLANTLQTFVPYKSFEACAVCLDSQRLGKQRAEGRQISRALIRGSGWFHHPAVQMWRGYHDALHAYVNACIDEWVRRGYHNRMLRYKVPKRYRMPWWWGGEIHRTHRSNLLRKDYEFYSRYKWKEPDDLDYFWPPYPKP